MWYPTQHSTSPYNHFGHVVYLSFYEIFRNFEENKITSSEVELMKLSRVKEKKIYYYCWLVEWWWIKFVLKWVQSTLNFDWEWGELSGHWIAGPLTLS